ncbi:hypothetical protein DBY68_015905 [Pseudocitrobacter sp. RIT415]|nr:hypothetical protein DBY68_015905 [Pseudocitrobacter sp. RIT 415]
MLIIASISFLLLPTLTIQLWRLLIQIKYTFAYHLMGISLICQYFYKLRKRHAFPGCSFYVQNRGR